MNDLKSSGMREQILETAARLFVARGYDGVSMREIAEACHLSKAGPYYHFKDKEDLFLAILDAHLVELEMLLSGIVAQPGDVRAKITAYVRAVFTQLPVNHRAIIRLATQEMGKIHPSARADFDHRYQEKFLNYLVEMLETGITSGQLRPFDPHMGVWALLGLMYPFVNQNQTESVTYLEMVIGLIEMVFFEGVERRA